MKVLFVCSGNICRSPMAAEYMRHRLADVGLSHVIVDSAGTLGIEAAPASPEAIEVMAEHGVNLTAHRSRGLRTEDLRTADLILPMGFDHLENITSRGTGSGLVHLLRAFETGPLPTPGAEEVLDPIGHPLSVYREVFEQIRRSVDHIVIYLRSGSGP